MMTILKIDSSITGEASVSRLLTGAIIAQLRARAPDARVIARDLVASPLSHLTLGGSGDADVLDEFLAADTIVIGAPMYNFTVPSQLKAWIDRLVIAGKTFRYTESGPVGLLTNKRVIIAIARGSLYGAGAPASALEHAQTYLNGVFSFLGLIPEFVIADGVGISPELREAGLASGLAEIERLAA
ncbi:MAG: FMN-dependent NADH-azoreductase [Sphingomicrobium sp.]